MAVRKAGRIATAVAAAALIGVGVAACGPDDGGSGKKDSASAEQSAPEAKAPPHGAELGKVPAKVNGGVITVGDPKAKHTVKIYEDARCPFCAKFEENGAQALVKPVTEGKVKIEYTIASFLDKNFGGSGSVNAANALRASVEAGKFAEFHAGVFANQPEQESDDAFTPAFLLKIADKVDGLRGPAFDKAVKNNSYESWTEEAMKSFQKDGVQATPNVLIDGEKVPGDGSAMFSESEFAKVLKDQGIG
ncbi:DsbA family protein [Streptomyces sp. NPDC059009]|uniref:DsbA family protein n=1 Tax=Streptomyces sp. NPDC059009 TaxID=3346694 RepID=UPI00367769D9